jgi:hypothetical protein
MSDVVVLNRDGVESVFYVDRAGFARATAFTFRTGPFWVNYPAFNLFITVYTMMQANMLVKYRINIRIAAFYRIIM